jgi:2-aminoadipate transaminase
VVNGVIEKQVPRLCEEYRQRRDVMLETLRDAMPVGIRWTKPEGGMFLLLTLPAGMDGAEVARAALAEKVLVVPGEDFHVVGGENTLRLNFSNCAQEPIRIGIKKLARIVQAQLETAKYPVSFSSV